MDALRLDALPPAAAALAVVEVLDRYPGDGHDGHDAQVRQTHVVTAWPLRIGRALDNDLVLADPHVAPHHLVIGPAETGARLIVGDTRNGVQLGAQRLAAGAHHEVPGSGPAVEMTVGRTPLRLRLPGHVLAAELPLDAAPPRHRHGAQIAAAALALMAALQFSTWLDNDPDGWLRAAASMAFAAIVAVSVWSGVWALLSKTFTRRSRFGWHLRVVLFAGCVLTVVGLVPNLLAFMFSLPVLADFGFVPSYAVAAAAFYFHLLAVEPAPPRLMRGVAVTGFVAAVALTFWQNQQRTDRFGDDLYMTHPLPARAAPRAAGVDRSFHGRRGPRCNRSSTAVRRSRATANQEVAMNNDPAQGGTVLVTGGSRGIGAATALQCAQRGWPVAVNYANDAASAEAVVARIRASGGQAIAVQADVSDEAQVLSMFRRVDAELPPPVRPRQQRRRRRPRRACRRDDDGALAAHVRDQRLRQPAVRARGSAAAVHPPRPGGWRDRQPVVGRGAPRFAEQLRRLRGRQGRDRHLHARPREGSGGRGRARERGAARHHRDRHPCQRRPARPRAADERATADAARRQRRRGWRARSSGCCRATRATPPALSST